MVKDKTKVVEMIKHEGHYVPVDICTRTNPRTSGGVSEVDDCLTCSEACEEVTEDCDKCVIQKIFDDYARLTNQLTSDKNEEGE